MVPIGVTDYDNKYDEYIVIDGIIEPVGNWSVDLSDYATKDEVNTALATKVTAVEGSRLITEAEAIKLASAEANFISSVDTNYFSVRDFLL